MGWGSEGLGLCAHNPPLIVNLCVLFAFFFFNHARIYIYFFNIEYRVYLFISFLGGKETFFF